MERRYQLRRVRRVCCAGCGGRTGLLSRSRSRSVGGAGRRTQVGWCQELDFCPAAYRWAWPPALPGLFMQPATPERPLTARTRRTGSHTQGGRRDSRATQSQQFCGRGARGVRGGGDGCEGWDVRARPATGWGGGMPYVGTRVTSHWKACPHEAVVDRAPAGGGGGGGGAPAPPPRPPPGGGGGGAPHPPPGPPPPRRGGAGCAGWLRQAGLSLPRFLQSRGMPGPLAFPAFPPLAPLRSTLSFPSPLPLPEVFGVVPKGLQAPFVNLAVDRVGVDGVSGAATDPRVPLVLACNMETRQGWGPDGGWEGAAPPRPPGPASVV